MKPATAFVIGANTAAAAALLAAVGLHVATDTPAYRMARQVAGLDTERGHAPGPGRQTPAPPAAALAPPLVAPVALARPGPDEKAHAINRAASPPAVSALQRDFGTPGLAEKIGPAGASDNTEPARAKATIAEVQTALLMRGYRPGSVDGVLGPRTRAAIRTFEADHGLQPTGDIDYDVMRALGIAGIVVDGFSRDWFYAPSPDEPAPVTPELATRPGDANVKGTPIPLGG